MMVRWLTVAGLALACQMAVAADLAQSVKAQLAQPAVLRGDFVQHRKVVGFKKPLVSRGDFVVARERGVLWRTVKPFAGELRLTRDEIAATQDGQTAFRLDAAKEPAVRMINGLLFALLNGDVTALAGHFTLEGQVEAARWQLQLTPRTASLAKLMKSISLQGDAFVRHIEIEETGGDRTVIDFTGQRAEPAALNAEERARFD
ncbi:outer membrane lipoprotein carrier protein LolA [Chitinolyticbacter meiyuanensis]|uniref:outer membrane lipoprotein carrier protein LolA n=1 Tax=Chitinolyticbacter meiyuanensis TaxID=682798 RepID=UPI001C9E646B|nr:outer membrane lipoprotein carrier protein LolA [Chitinolyticbacter meiyuanensis]